MNMRKRNNYKSWMQSNTSFLRRLAKDLFRFD